MLLKENSKRVSESKTCEELIKCFFIRAQPKFLSLKSMGEGSNNNRNHPYEHRNQNDPMTRRSTPPYKILELKLICLTIVKTMPKPMVRSTDYIDPPTFLRCTAKDLDGWVTPTSFILYLQWRQNQKDFC